MTLQLYASHRIELGLIRKMHKHRFVQINDVNDISLGEVRVSSDLTCLAGVVSSASSHRNQTLCNNLHFLTDRKQRAHSRGPLQFRLSYRLRQSPLPICW